MKYYLFFVLFLFSATSYAEDKQAPENFKDLADMSVEELLELEVTSVSKKSQDIKDAAAAVYVLREEDIRRSGATSIPEVLRLVPGLHVARISANNWAITSRGFNGLFANKLLVLIDGRTVYTPLFSGVFWDVQDTLLEDIERIEVIRGPGAALWGSNAVNGVINIITKHSEDTHGGLLSTGGGDEERGFVNLRYGGETETKVNYRTYLKYYNRDDNHRAFSGDSVVDDSESIRGGFRTDWDISAEDALTIQGDAYYNDEGFEFIEPIVFPPFNTFKDERRYLKGANILSRWTHLYANDSESQLQFYIDRVDRDDGVLVHKRNTLDLDFQHRFQASESHEILWGVGYRFYRDDIDNKSVIAFSPEKENVSQTTFFAHDEIEITPEKLKFIIGSKFEQNHYSGFEVQPNARLLFTPETNDTYWIAVSRAVRTPSRATDDMRLNYASGFVEGTPLPFLVTFNGSNQYESEDLIAYEAGYRGQVLEDLIFDAAVFYNYYENLQTLEPTDASLNISEDFGTPFLLLPRTFDNEARGHAHGVELAFDYQAREFWRLVLTYTYFDLNIIPTTKSNDDFVELTEGFSPEHQFVLRSLLSLTDELDFDSALRYVDELKSLNIDDYFALDLRLAWKVRPDLEISLVAQNVTDEKHAEFFANDFVRGDVAAIDRGVYLKADWRF